MGFFSRFERHVEDGFEGAADKMFDAPISPVQISKKAEKAMRREKMVGTGKQYAPTLYTVLVNPQDDQRLFGYYPTLAGETETYLSAKAAESGLLMDGQPLVRFIVDDELKRGKFDVIAEMVSAPIIAQLRNEEMSRYGLGGAAIPAQSPMPQQAYAPKPTYQQQPAQYVEQYDEPAQQPQAGTPLPYVPEEEIDRSLDYGEYTFDSKDFQGQQQEDDSNNQGVPAPQPQPTHQPEDLGFDAAPTHVATSAAAPAVAPVAQTNGVTAATLTNMSNNRIYTLTSPSNILGRGSESTLSISDINASRRHAEVYFVGNGQWHITDLGSTNGTKVNGVRVQDQVLQEGDRITVGMTNFLFGYAR